jgi:hypothetical protein
MKKARTCNTDRFVLTHCSVLRSDLISAMQQMSIIASIQPQFLFSDAQWLHLRLNANLIRYWFSCSSIIHDVSSLCRGVYSWKRLLDAGIHCAGGSDAPVESANPLKTIYAAMFRPSPPSLSFAIKSNDPIRKSRVAALESVFSASQNLSFLQALQLMTKGSAFAAKREDCLGELRPGFFADFVVVDRDIVNHPEELPSAVVVSTWISGKCKFLRHTSQPLFSKI